MAVFGSLLFKRSLKQFLDCDDLESSRGVALIEKLRQSAGESLEHLIEAIPIASGLHRAMLTEICLENVGGTTEDLFLKGLDSDATEIRAATASILSQGSQIHPARLLKKLHEPKAPRTEIIGILEFQAAQIKPEQIINNALRLDRADAEQLLKLAHKSEQPLDLDVLHIEPESIDSPSTKIMLLRFLGEVEQSGVAQLIVRFLSDSNKTVTIEALKALKGLKVDFDASLLLPAYESMTEVVRQLAFEVIEARADAEMVSKLAPLTCRADEMRETFIKLFARHVTTESLEEFLRLLDLQEWWGKEQALKGLHKFGNDRLFAAAQGLSSHENEFISEQAQRLAVQASDPGDVTQLWENALHENWQVRDNAIDTIGKSGNRESMGILKKVIDKFPESATTVLRAVTELGHTKGLEIAFACLRMPEALVQREALESAGKLATARHAKMVRDKLMQIVPSLQATVRDTAGEVISHLTQQFKLQPLDVDQETYFDTRLIKLDDTGAFDENTTQTQPTAQASQQIQNIEEFKKGDLWLDRYRIDREIGRGAMGRVMLATDEMVGENLILKFMHPELTAEEASRERFLREVRYSRKVSHPNVIRVHDMLYEDGLSAISMEFFESRGIDELLRKKKYFEIDEGLKILLQMANGVGAAHDQEVIHRDLKPSNVLMSNKGLVKIVDFGIASADSKADATLTQVGSIIGTPAFLSPERARGLEADHRSDIYALGVIAYCMFTGKLPYVGEPMSMLFQHIEGKALPLHEVRDTISPRVSLLVQKFMAVDLEDRLQTMDDVAEAIREVQKKLA